MSPEHRSAKGTPALDAYDRNRDGLGLAVSDFVLAPTIAVISVASTAPTAACPRCRGLPDRAHSRYTRTIADLPSHDRPVALRLRVRRFRCTTPDCPRTISCERLPDLVSAHARSTDRLAGAHRLLGLALGGEAGARRADHLDIPTSPDTLLHRAQCSDGQPVPPPRFVGIDDWAWRKGRRCPSGEDHP